MRENSAYRFLVIFLLAVAVFFITYLSANFAQEGQRSEAPAQPLFLSSPSVESRAQSASSTNSTVGSGTSLKSSAQIIADFHLKEGLPSPQVQAQAALIEDLKTRNRYLSLNIYRPWPLASLTKLMTIYVSLQVFNPSDKIQITQDDLAPYDDFMRAGSAYSVEDLIKLMFAISSNTAANSLARAYGFDNFISLMNNQADKWQMWQTHFEESIGLSPNNITSAADLEKLVFNFYKNYPSIFDLSQNPKQTVTDINSGETQTVSSIDYFAGQADFLGGKTGSTDEAQENLISLFNYQGRPILIVVLGSSNRFKATQDLFNWFKNSYTF
jgi:D-alanyl-D-alanine endopeptidase (penicillin-binding protein 7)